jgi:hypothetical protein
VKRDSAQVLRMTQPDDGVYANVTKVGRERYSKKSSNCRSRRGSKIKLKRSFGISIHYFAVRMNKRRRAIKFDALQWVTSSSTHQINRSFQVARGAFRRPAATPIVFFQGDRNTLQEKWRQRTIYRFLNMDTAFDKTRIY